MPSPPDPEAQLNQKLARLFATIAARDAQTRRELRTAGSPANASGGRKTGKTTTTPRTPENTNAMNYEELTGEQEQTIGETLVEAFGLKEAKHGSHPRSLKSYDPPRYFTQWGTKTALGVARTAYGILSQHPAHKKTTNP